MDLDWFMEVVVSDKFGIAECEKADKLIAEMSNEDRQKLLGMLDEMKQLESEAPMPLLNNRAFNFLYRVTAMHFK